MVKGFLVRVFVDFYLNATIWKSMSSTFITLIPKKDKFTKVSYYCPISLVKNVYKVIKKVLYRKLSEILDTEFC